MKFLVTISGTTPKGAEFRKVVSVNVADEAEAVAVGNAVEGVYVRRLTASASAPRKLHAPTAIPVVVEGGGVPEEITLEEAILWALTEGGQK